MRIYLAGGGSLQRMGSERYITVMRGFINSSLKYPYLRYLLLLPAQFLWLLKC